jgi:hypothetical protein
MAWARKVMRYQLVVVAWSRRLRRRYWNSRMCCSSMRPGTYFDPQGKYRQAVMINSSHREQLVHCVPLVLSKIDAHALLSAGARLADAPLQATGVPTTGK